MTTEDYERLTRCAVTAVIRAEETFIRGIGAGPRFFKAPGDFATDVDLEIEADLREELKASTSLSVIGEEVGGNSTSTPYWVVDPVDGTTNFSVGHPLSAILVALVDNHQPVISVVAIPSLRMRLTAWIGSGIFLNDAPWSPRPEHLDVQGLIAVPTAGRVKPELYSQLVHGLDTRGYRIRVSGSVGVDLAFCALGINSAAYSASRHLWDNAAGVLLCREAGLVVTDRNGQEWTAESGPVIAGTPRAHRDVVSTIKSTSEDPITVEDH